MATPAKFQLEDILNKKKPPPTILDLSSISVTTDQELRSVLDKMPDYKIQPEKREEGEEQMQLLTLAMRRYRRRLRAAQREEDEIELDMEDVGNTDGRVIELPELSRLETSTSGYSFLNPCPESMQSLRLIDLSSVDINWKMLTLARPESKQDEELFSRLVELDKLRLQTRGEESRASMVRGGRNPFLVVKQPSASRGGVTEKSIKVCHECLEEFCTGTCVNFQYELYQRIDLSRTGDVRGEDEGAQGGKRRKKRTRRRKGKKNKEKKTKKERQ